MIFPELHSQGEQVQQEKGRCQQSGSGGQWDLRQETQGSHACLVLICKTQSLHAREKHRALRTPGMFTLLPFHDGYRERNISHMESQNRTERTTLYKMSQESRESICWLMVCNSSLKQLSSLSPSFTRSPQRTDAQLAEVPERHLPSTIRNLNIHKPLNCLHGYISESQQHRFPPQDCFLAGRLASHSHQINNQAPG